MEKVNRLASLIFVLAVTVCLVAFAFVQAARGPSGLLGVVVYAFAAGFGLEFVGAAWTGRFASGGRRRLES